MANRQRHHEHQRQSNDTAAPAVPVLRHITPFANDADWAQTLAALSVSMSVLPGHTRRHVQHGIRDFEQEIVAQLRRRKICQDALAPGNRLRPSVELNINARIHQLQSRATELQGLLYGKAPKRAHLVAMKSDPVDPDAETREAYVRALIREAVWVIRFSRFPKNGAPAEIRSGMPDPVIDYWDAFGREKAEATRPLPTSQQLSQCDAVIHWFFWIQDREMRSCLFLRHIPLSWRKVGDILDISHTNAMWLERDAVSEICRRLTSVAA